MTAAPDAEDPPESDPAFTRLRDAAIELLTDWVAPDATQEDLRHAYLEHLSAHPAACAKTGPPAHLTASALVVDAAGTATSLVLHGKGRRWFQPGGHLEAGDADLVAGALREAREETGLTQLRIDPVPLRLDRHELDAAFGRCREHLDVQFLVVAAVDEITPSAESLAVRWWPLAELPDVEAVGALAAAARGRLDRATSGPACGRHDPTAE